MNSMSIFTAPFSLLCRAPHSRRPPLNGDRPNATPAGPHHGIYSRLQFVDPIRQLQNVMERMITMSGDRVTLLDIPEEILAVIDVTTNRHAGSALREFRDKSERDFILATLKRSLGNISQSAIELGVGRSYLHRRLAVLGIAKKEWFS
jgi:two-component system, NtrC family, nitrogen regulation response regulator NtrX